MQGQMNAQLTDTGREQAEVNAALVAALGVDRIFASPLDRCRASVVPLASKTGLEPVFDDRLMEWNSGDWSGHLYTDLHEKWAEEFDAWRADMWDVRAPGGENFVDLQDRGGAFLDEHVLGHEGTTAIVSHGFIGRAMIALILDLPPSEALEIRQYNDVVFSLAGGRDAWQAEHYRAGEGPFPGLSVGEVQTVA